MLVAHEAGDSGGLLDDTVRGLVEVHADDRVAGDAHVAHALLRGATVFHDVLIRDLDGEDVVFHVLRGDALLEVCLHLALVAGVGVDDVPVAGGHVELAAQLGDRFLFGRGRCSLFLFHFLGRDFLGGNLLDHLVDDFLSSSVGQGFGGLPLDLFLGFLEDPVLAVLFVAHDFSSCE